MVPAFLVRTVLLLLYVMYEFTIYRSFTRNADIRRYNLVNISKEKHKK